MPYATAQQLVDQYGLDEISQLLSDEEYIISATLLAEELAGVPIEDDDEAAAVERAFRRLGQVFKAQSSFIDSKIGQRYSLPLPMTEEAINATPILECCLALSRASLCDDDDNMTDDIKADRKFWRDWLDQIANGKAIIPGITVTQNSSGAVQQRLTGQARSNINWSAF